MTNSIFKLTCVGLIGMIGLAGCQTAEKPVTYDKKEKAVFVYNAADKRTAMPDPRKVSTIQDAIKQLEEAAAKKPGDLKTLQSLAQLQLTANNLKAAERTAKKMLMADYRNREAKVVMAHVAFYKGNMLRAKTMVDRLGGAKSKESEVLNLMAMIALRDGDDGDAIKLAAAAVKRNANDLGARMNLGLLLLRYRKVSSARKQFQDVLAKMPDNLDAKLHIAITYAVEGKYKDADRYYQQVAKGNSRNPLLAFNSAVLKMRRNQFDDAVKGLRSYVKTYSVKYSMGERALALIDDIKKDKAASSGLSDSQVADLQDQSRDGGEISLDNDAGEKEYTITGESGVVDSAH